MTIKTNKLGQHGEDLAEEFLKKQGYKILQRNFKTRFGEIDIIAKEAGVICFVEVRTRTADWHGHPFESVSFQKRRRLTKTAIYFLQENDLMDAEARFDVVAVIPEDSGEYHLEVIKNAFEVGE